MICAVIAHKSYSEILSLLHSFSMAEIRLDLLDLTPGEIVGIFSSHPRLIVTCRKKDSVSDPDRLNALLNALDHGAWAADIDLNDPPGFIDAVKERRLHGDSRLILSCHHFNRTPASPYLEEVLASMRKLNPDIIKIAAYAQDTGDMLRLLAFYDHPCASEYPLILLSMGHRGILSRIAAPFLGAPFTYAAADPSSITAPGQLSYSKMEQIFTLMGSGEKAKRDTP